MKLKTLIIDDEPVALAKLKSYVEKVPFLELVAECQGTSEALEYLSSNSVDVIFTDIELPDVNGISFVEALTPRPMIVFTTAYREYAVEGFRLSAVDYLVKPYRFVDFQRAANKVLEVYRSRESVKQSMIAASTSASNTTNESLFIKIETRYERISPSQIRYIKGYGEYLQIFIEGTPRPLLTLSSFQAMLDKLDESFLQVHRSYIVNMNKVVKIEKSRITMDSETIIPVSSGFKDDFIAYIQSHSVGRSVK